MRRSFFVAIALILSESASAQYAASPQRAPGSSHTRGEVLANGRCNGLSYGTGARRCNTRSGGPVGGISGRN